MVLSGHMEFAKQKQAMQTEPRLVEGVSKAMKLSHRPLLSRVCLPQQSASPPAYSSPW